MCGVCVCVGGGVTLILRCAGSMQGDVPKVIEVVAIFSILITNSTHNFASYVKMNADASVEARSHTT